MSSSATMVNMAEMAASFGLAEAELVQQAMESFVREKKRQVLQLKLDILSRYGADTVADLESKIAHGAVVEHPAWEDLIVAENLTARLEELDAHLADLQRAEDHRP